MLRFPRHIPVFITVYMLGIIVPQDLAQAQSTNAVSVSTSIAEVHRLSDVFPQKIVVGVRSDASPFSYRTVSRVQEDILSGYGGYMVEICRRVLTQMTSNGPFMGFSIEAYDITAGNRFDYLNDGSVDMLCGPDSITLNRLRKHNASHPLFLSGLTYVSVANDDIPRTRYCGGVIGLVRRTTAESTGLQIIARNRELHRFHAPLESFLSIMSDPVAYAPLPVTSESESENEQLLDEKIARDVIPDELVGFLPPQSENTVEDSNKSLQATAYSEAKSSETVVVHPGDRIQSRMVTTGECANGYEKGPVVFFDNHVDGLNALCAREILFYMGDFDIIRERLRGMTGCETVMRRETITDEAYGAYFRKFRGDSGNIDSSGVKSSNLDSVLYAEFNNVLLQKMQATESILDYEFKREFGDEEKTKDLQQFFDSFKFASHY